MCIFKWLTSGFHFVVHGQTSHNNAIPGITVLKLIFISILNRSNHKICQGVHIYYCTKWYVHITIYQTIKSSFKLMGTFLIL
jgi:predicted nucleotidyltransferase